MKAQKAETLESVKKAARKEVVVEALRPYGTSIFTEMSALANEHDAVNLSQGFPDWDGPEEIRAKAAEAIMRGPNQYAPSIGIPAIRQAIANKMDRFYGVAVDPDLEITVTSGATEALCATLLGILEPGDEVILLEPCYDSYAPICSLAHATIRYVSLNMDDFSLPRRELAKAFNEKTKVIMVNNPHNPTGKVFTREELEFIGSLCREHDALVIGDEVYEHLVFDGRKHTTMLALPEIRDRSLVISSTAKTFSMTGWKIGYVMADPHLSEAVRMSHQFITFCGQAALQEAMAHGINFNDRYYENFVADYLRRRDWLCDALRDIGFKVFTPTGAYYVLVDVRSMGFEDDVDFCVTLTRDAGVAAIPCSFFWNERRAGRHLARFCFCKKDETLREGVNRLKRWAQSR